VLRSSSSCEKRLRYAAVADEDEDAVGPKAIAFCSVAVIEADEDAVGTSLKAEVMP
jgi:hypothetical protein